MNDSGRQQVLKWLKESFLLLYQKEVRGIEGVLEEYSIYDRVVLNMGLIQEVRYKQEARYKGIWDENWQTIVMGWEVPSKDQDLRRLRNQVVHAYQIYKDRGRVAMVLRGGGVASPDQAREVLEYTLQWLLEDLAKTVVRR